MARGAQGSRGRRIGRGLSSVALTAALLPSFLLGACGGGTETTTVTVPGESAAELAPEKAGVVRTRVPIYAGALSADRRPDGPQVLKRLPDVQRPDEVIAVPNISGSEGQTVAQWLHTLNNDIASFWQANFNQAGYAYAAGRSGIFSTQPIDTACGQARFDNGAFYCPGDRTLYLPVPWFEQRINPAGDAADAIVVAHENGHHVQDLLDLLTNRRSKDVELQADCLAGNWAASVYRRGLLQTGDIEEAFSIINQSGDPPGTPTEIGHGSSQERLAAFNHGYNGGNAAACL